MGVLSAGEFRGGVNAIWAPVHLSDGNVLIGVRRMCGGGPLRGMLGRHFGFARVHGNDSDFNQTFCNNETTHWTQNSSRNGASSVFMGVLEFLYETTVLLQFNLGVYSQTVVTTNV